MGTKVSTYFVSDELVEWIDEKVEEGEYRSRSHLIERAVRRFRENVEPRGGF